MKDYFGTDGIRGCVGKLPMIPDFILKLGWAIGTLLAATCKKPKVLIGKDTRLSGYMFESALQSGLSASGVDVILVGPMPTPGVAYLSSTHCADLAIVITASHNYFTDNGIKLFAANGEKVSKGFELQIAKTLVQSLTINHSMTLGKVWRMDDAAGRYIEFCKSTVPQNTHFADFKIILDCANGATYHIAPNVFKELGASVIALNISPDGLNINKNSGTLSLNNLKESVLREDADLGIVFDGDGDRVLFVDKLGEVVDGDEILFIILKFLLITQRFHGGVVGTVMTNSGLETMCHKLDVPFVRTAVGEKNILTKLKEEDWFLGGEPTGHIINLNLTITSDGIMTALTLIVALIQMNKELHDIKMEMNKFPQMILNIPYANKQIDLNNKELKEMIRDSENRLNKKGRIVLRYSGTEPVLRLLVEGENQHLVNEILQSINATIQKLMQ